MTALDPVRGLPHGVSEKEYVGMYHRPGRLLQTALAALLLAEVGRCAKVDEQFDFAQGLFIHRDYRSAIEEFKRLVASFPGTAQAAAAAFRIAEAHSRLEQREAAESAYETALKKHPDAEDVPLGSYSLGRVRLELGKTKSALAAFKVAIGKGKGELRREALVGAAECQVQLSLLQDAAATYEVLLADFPQSKHRADVLFSSGWVLASLNRHAEAVTRYTTLVREFPKYGAIGKARLALSDCYTALGAFDKAAQTLEQLSGDVSVAADVLLRRAWNHFRAGEKKEAAAAFARFVEAHPDSEQVGSACFNAGVAFFELKDYERAVSMFDRVLSGHKPGVPGGNQGEARYWRGLCLFNLGRHGDVVDCLRQLVEEPGGLDAQKRVTLVYTYAQALAKAGRIADAIVLYEDLLRDAPASPHAPGVLYCLATAYERAGKPEQAVATLDRLLEGFPDSSYKEQALFAMGEYLFRVEEFDRAATVLAKLAKQGKETDRLLYRMAWVHHKQRKFTESAERFLQLAAMSSEFAQEALYMAARSKEEAGDRGQAVELYERVLQQHKSGPFAAKSMYRLGFLYEGDKAVANLARYAKLQPQPSRLVELKLRLAESAYDAGDVDGAARHYGQLLGEELPPDKAAIASYGMAWCHLRREQFGEADRLFAKVTPADVEATVAADAVLQRGEIAYRRKQYAPAMSFFGEAAKEDSQRGGRALYMLAWCKRHLGDRDGAIKHFGDLLRERPECSFYGDAAIRLAEGLIARGDCEQARDVLSGSLARLRGTEQEEAALHLTSDALVTLAKWQRVLECSKALQEKFPNSDRRFMCSFRAGLAYKELGLLDEAEAAFRETVEQTETVEGAQAQFNIGTIYFGRKQYLEAAKNFLRVEMLYDYPDLSPKSLYHAADSFRRAGEEDRANLYVQRMVEEYPDSEWTRKVREK